MADVDRLAYVAKQRVATAEAEAASLRAQDAAGIGTAARPCRVGVTSGVHAQVLEQVRRAEAIVTDFRTSVRTDLRTHLARGGSRIAGQTLRTEQELHPQAVAHQQQVAAAVLPPRHLQQVDQRAVDAARRLRRPDRPWAGGSA
mgnify:CR=1 FL=1